MVLNANQGQNVMKIHKNWLPPLILATPPALRYGLVGSVSLQNTIIGSNMILDTSQSDQKVKKLVFKRFKLQIVAEIDRFLHFFMLRPREFQFLPNYEKTEGLRAQGCYKCYTNIKSTIAVILSPNLSLYDLQKPRYRFGPNTATPKKGRGPPDLGLAIQIYYPIDSCQDWSSSQPPTVKNSGQ